MTRVISVIVWSSVDLWHFSLLSRLGQTNAAAAADADAADKKSQKGILSQNNGIAGRWVGVVWRVSLVDVNVDSSYSV